MLVYQRVIKSGSPIFFRGSHDRASSIAKSDCPPGGFLFPHQFQKEAYQKWRQKMPRLIPWKTARYVKGMAEICRNQRTCLIRLFQAVILDSSELRHARTPETSMVS